MADNPKIFKIAEITRMIRQVLEDTFGKVWVEGEISNFRRPASGHCYFTLKDETAQIAAVLFRGSQRDMSFQPADGLMVRAFGDITVYDRDGKYQIIVRNLEPAGKGDLHARFEALKAKLLKEGLFDAARKRTLPLLPRHVGIVTSPTGAAIHDMLNVIARRFPNLHVVLAPVKVQGAGAAEEIAAAIDLLNQRGDLDVLIVGRGGGSLEDLWSFNEEIVARAIARSGIPVISAVGHEIDFTISDFVADLRAPTPSAAAELVVGQKAEFERHLKGIGDRLRGALLGRVLQLRNQLVTARGSAAFREPAGLVRQHAQRVDSMFLRMQHATGDAMHLTRQQVGDLSLRARHAMQLTGRQGAQDVRRIAAQLRALSPLAVLSRGYSVTIDSEGHILRDARRLKAGALLRTRLAQGRIQSVVKEIEGDVA